ncbi:hypothetical protein L3X38_038361 [Prunus dulcis]|uniref:Uncharacterized protein n=1 Tax=Prunus dulcis TaxID=3755 RepID=A0AAD4YS39_PRUDU|nr:hypothetical protein L3X38_038361 [Prunus dulcis]
MIKPVLGSFIVPARVVEQSCCHWLTGQFTLYCLFVLDGVCFFLDGLSGRFTVDLKIYCITRSGCEI